jgi:hypothetical protein
MESLVVGVACVVGLAYLGMWGFLLVVQDGLRRIRSSDSSRGGSC